MLESLPTQAPLRELHTKMLPDFNPISNDTCSDPLLIYYDGSAVPRGAGWAFAVFTWQGGVQLFPIRTIQIHSRLLLYPITQANCQLSGNQ